MRISLTSKWRPPVIVLLVVFAIQACGSDPDEVFEVLVWVDVPVSEEDHVPDGDVYDGPCCPMRLLKVLNHRELSVGQYDSLERVAEFTENADVTAKWRVPVESYVTGIDAEWLIVNSSGGRVSVNLKGDNRRANYPKPEEEQACLGTAPTRYLQVFSVQPENRSIWHAGG